MGQMVWGHQHKRPYQTEANMAIQHLTFWVFEILLYILLKFKTKFNTHLFWITRILKIKFLNYLKIIWIKSKQFDSKLFIFWYILINVLKIINKIKLFFDNP